MAMTSTGATQTTAVEGRDAALLFLVLAASRLCSPLVNPKAGVACVVCSRRQNLCNTLLPRPDAGRTTKECMRDVDTTKEM